MKLGKQLARTSGGLDSIDWYGMSGPERRGGGENVMVVVVEGVHVHGDEHWTNTDGHDTGRAWKSRIRRSNFIVTGDLETSIYDVVLETK